MLYVQGDADIGFADTAGNSAEKHSACDIEDMAGLHFSEGKVSHPLQSLNFN